MGNSIDVEFLIDALVTIDTDEAVQYLQLLKIGFKEFKDGETFKK